MSRVLETDRSRLARQELARACQSDLDPVELWQQMRRVLRRLFSVDAAFLATADPETLLFTGAYAEEPLTEVSTQLLDNEFSGADVNTFASLATSSRHVASLDQATHHDRASSARYRDIMRPIGLGDELRSALIVDGRCWGFLCLHRQDSPLGFSAEEAAVVARIGPLLAAGLRQAVLLRRGLASRAPLSPGVVLLDHEQRVVAVTPEAEQLLSLMDDAGSRELPLPLAVHTAAAALIASESSADRAAPPSSIRVPTRAGPWLSLRASRLHGPQGRGHIAVILEGAEPAARVPVLLSAYGLSSREAEVATLVLRGSATSVIAERLHISRYTVQDHLKAVFGKVGVRSRRDLVGTLIGPGPSDSR